MPPIRRNILANPDEPRAGDDAYSLYNKSHPVLGEQDTIKYLKKNLAGLRGRRTTITVRGRRIDPETGEVHRFSASRTVSVTRYSDVFGPGSVYSSAIHAIRDKHSSDKLITDSIIIEAA